MRSDNDAPSIFTTRISTRMQDRRLGSTGQLNGTLSNIQTRTSSTKQYPGTISESKTHPAESAD